MPGLTADARHGPLPALLLLLTMSTGLVDATTFLRLGHVFVANMTGNVVFLAFALMGAREFSIPASATALALFLAGALAGGRLHRRLAHHRGRQLALGCAVQVVLVGAAVALSLAADWRGQDLAATAARYAMIALLGAAMGLQNAVGRGIGVPGLTTTVLTMTLTGIAADSRFGAASRGAPLRPFSVGALFVGAAVGALLVLHDDISLALGAVLALVTSVGAAAYLLSRRDPAWIAP